MFKPLSLQIIFCGFLLACLTACPGNKEQTDPGPRSSTASPDISSSKLQSSPPLLTPSSLQSNNPTAGIQRGIFIFGDGLQIFKPCGGRKEYWLEDSADKSLEKQYKALKLMELEPVYVELTGTLKSTKKMDGFALDYAEALKVNEVKLLRPWLANGSCFAPDFIAQGPKPDWSLQILRDGDVFFKSNEGEFPYVDTLAYSAPKQAGNRWNYELHYRTPDEEVMMAEFSEESCAFEGRNFNYSAKIEFRGMTYTGCANKF